MRSASGFLVALKGESELAVESSENFAGAARAGPRLLRARRDQIPGCARAGLDPFRHAAREHSPFLIAPERNPPGQVGHTTFQGLPSQSR